MVSDAQLPAGGQQAVLGGTAARFYALRAPEDWALRQARLTGATMPIFGNQQQDQGSATWEPQAAGSRLAHTAGANPSGVFTSDLSVSEGVLQSLRQMGQNQEMLQFTQGVYEARELALTRMQAEAAQARSSGIVGVSVEVKNHVWGEHATEFLATGTAIRRLSDEHRLPETTPRPTFTLGLDN
ncbi:MAG TPA: heavy metal-binding domain-containing protein [Streptosporangiaceae bacterium]|nr:heavy metal-binding domain-containing protein [Streptosporangiaceae bacterium]